MVLLHAVPSILAFVVLPVWVYVLFLSVIFILVYFYLVSELVDAKKLSVWILTLVIIFTGIHVYFNLGKKPPQIKHHFLILPLHKTDSNDNSTQLLFWNVINEQIFATMPKGYTVLFSDNLQTILDSDSLTNQNYRQQWISKLKADFLLTGNSVADDSIRCELIKAESDSILLEKDFSLADGNFSTAASELISSIWQTLGVNDDKKLSFGQISVSANVYQKYLLAKNLLEQEKYDQAIDVANNVISEDSSFASAFMLAGKAYFLAGLKLKEKGKAPVEQFARAFELLNKSIELDSTLAEAYAFLGEYFIHKERWSLAEQNLVQAMELNPRISRIYLNFSRLHPSRYKKLGFRSEEELYQRAIEINPCDRNAYLMLSDYYMFQNMKAKAIETLESYLQINPNSVPVLMALGKIYMLKRDVLKIIDVYNRVIDLDPYNADAFYNLGVWYYNSEDFENAEKFFQRAIAINNHLNSHLYLAYLYEMKGEMNKAIEHLRYRIRNKKGFDDEFAEEARKHLYEIMHGRKENTSQEH